MSDTQFQDKTRQTQLKLKLRTQLGTQLRTQPSMNPSKVEHEQEQGFHHHHHHHHHHHPSIPITNSLSPTTTTTTTNNNPSFSLLFHPSSPSSSSESPQRSPLSQTQLRTEPEPDPDPDPLPLTTPTPKINPEPHISSQFYTFNSASHALMISCLIQNRVASPGEIRSVTPVEVLKSWRSVWKDRNEDTAYITAWKRIQDKLHAHIDKNGSHFLCFKNNSHQFVSHIHQWQDIVMSSHSDGDVRHLGLRETIEKIKQVWTVGAKFYGIPESFIRVCLASCCVCSGGFSGSSRSKRRRFEYTESLDVPAKDVPSKLQQLANKHKVVLCIRQKYIRYKPFMAEVKDYACHRAGEPGSSKKGKGLKREKEREREREPYASKRCGCGFRIRAIVPITKYNEKDKSFVYQEEGMAVFKLYAVHTGHEPGPLDGNARIMHRVVGQKGGGVWKERETETETEMEYGVNEELENEGCVSVVQQVQELKSEVSLLESRIWKLPPEALDSVSRELYRIVSKVRELGYGDSKAVGVGVDAEEKMNSDVMLVGENDMPHWNDPHDDRLYGDGKDMELIEDDEDSFGRTLGNVVPWDHMRDECRTQKEMIEESCKTDKWINASEFDEKSILVCDEEDSKLTKPLRHDSLEDDDVGLVALQVENFYPENPKWYDSPCGLDSGTGCGESDFRHGEMI